MLLSWLFGRKKGPSKKKSSKKKGPSGSRASGRKKEKDKRSSLLRRSSPQKAKRPQVKKEHSLQHIGDVIHFFPKVKAGVIRLRRGSLQIGDTICCKGATTDFRQKVSSMEIDHKPIDTAKKGQEIGILLKKRVRIGDKVYK